MCIELMKETSTKIRVKNGLWSELPCILTHHHLHALTIICMRYRKKYTLHSQTGNATTLLFRRKNFSLPSNSSANENYHSSVSKKPSPPWTSNFLQWTFIYNSASQPPPFPIKQAPFLYSLDLPMICNRLQLFAVP